MQVSFCQGCPLLLSVSGAGQQLPGRGHGHYKRQWRPSGPPDWHPALSTPLATFLTALAAYLLTSWFLPLSIVLRPLSCPSYGTLPGMDPCFPCTPGSLWPTLRTCFRHFNGAEGETLSGAGTHSDRGRRKEQERLFAATNDRKYNRCAPQAPLSRSFGISGVAQERCAAERSRT
jgi:hypothetical protein